MKMKLCSPKQEAKMEDKAVGVSLSFGQALQRLINQYNQDNDLQTPDFILRDYVIRCLDVWGLTVEERDHYYNLRRSDTTPMLEEKKRVE